LAGKAFSEKAFSKYDNVFFFLTGRPILEKISITVASKCTDDRNAMVALLTEQKDFFISSIVDDSFSLIHSTIKLQPNVIVMDFRLEDLDCLEIAPIIKRNSPATALIVLSTPDNRIAVDRILRAGISGYLLKRQDFVYLALSVRCVSFGGLYISETIRERTTRYFPMHDFAAHGNGGASSGTGAARNVFTLTELQIFQGIVSGYSDHDIAVDLNISTGAVRNCVCKAKKKVGLRNRTQMSLYAMSCGLISPKECFPSSVKKT